MNGLLLYQVRWAYTKHPTTILQNRRDGEQVVRVGREVCKVLRRSTTLPDEETGEHTSLVEWPETWLSVWELCSSLNLVIRYEASHPRNLAEAIRLKQPLISAMPHRVPWILEPEVEEDIDKRADIDSEVFQPEERKDYTTSFLSWQRRKLDSEDGLQIASSIRMLNMPVRQRLTFSDWFCAEVEGQEPQSYDTTRDTLLRALFVYVVGDAWFPSCSSCDNIDHSLPFTKCVALDGVFNGACTNCVFVGRGQTCDLHNNAPRSRNLARCIEAHAVPEASSGSSSHSSPANSPGNFSSVGSPSIVNHTTPPSSPPKSGWISPSPMPPGSPELGLEDLAGGNGSVRPNAASSPSPKPTKRKSSSPEPKKNRSKRRMKFRIVKHEDTSSTTSNSLLSHAGTCRGGLSYCTHPIAGCKPLAIEDDSQHPPSDVFNDRKFGSGQASDEEVKYVLSRCSCANTQLLRDAWDRYRADPAENESQLEFESKEEFLSIACYEQLTELAMVCCPVPSWPGPKERVEIDLTD